MRFYFMDAFADVPYCGNQAGVVLLSERDVWPEPLAMLRFAAELRASESAFIRPEGNGVYRLRFFTPTCEVDLCGHAMLAGFSALYKEGRIHSGDCLTARTNAGDVHITLDGTLVWMDMSPTQIIGIPDDELSMQVYASLGLNKPEGLEPCMVKTGLVDLLVPVQSRAALMNAQPDLERIARLSERLDVVGFHLYALTHQSEPLAYCRDIAPLVGIPEEAATGTSSASLACHLVALNLAPTDASFTFLQGEAMKRPSRIRALVDSRQPDRARIAGHAICLAQGELHPDAMRSAK